MSIIWNFGPAAERARFNLKLKKKIKRRRRKPQAPSFKLDKSSRIGYCRIQGQVRDGMAIDICEGPLMGPRNSAAEILQQRPVKSPARGRNGSCRVMVPASRNSSRATSLKLQALKDIIERFLDPGPRIGNKESRIEAPSSKVHGSWNKFHGARTVRPDQDKCILWMSLVEGNLMR